MAERPTPLDLSTEEGYRAYIASKRGAAEQPKARAFSQNQSMKQMQTDGTIVGGAEQKVGSAIGAATKFAGKIPIIGGLVNPALELAQGIQENVIDPIAQRASAAMLLNDIQDQGSFANNWRFAKQQAKKISFGQALASDIGGEIARLAPSALEQRLPSFMREDFNVFNDAKRNRAFRDEWAGIFASGAGDLLFGFAGTKGTGAAMRYGTTKAIGRRQIEPTAAGMEDYRLRVDSAVSEVEAGAPRSSMAKLMDEVIREDRPEVLLTNPLVLNTNNPNRAATLLSEMKDAQSVRNYLLAENGDADALGRLFNESPSIHDAITNNGAKDIQPLYDFRELWDLPDEAATARVSAILEDLRKRNPQLAGALEDFAVERAKGIGITGYQPGKYAALERLTTLKEGARLGASMGEFTPFGKGGWQTKVYQTSAYDRTVRLIQWYGSGKPQGVINITNPRKNEALNDILAELTSISLLRNAEGDAFRRDIASKWVRATNDTERARVVLEAEEGALRIMADKLGVEGLREVVDGQDPVKYIRELHSSLTSRRDSTIEYLRQNNGVFVDENGTISLIDGPHLTVRSNAVESIPFLDLRSLEMELISHVRKRASDFGEYSGVSPVGMAGRLDAKAVSTNLRRVALKAETFFDVANLVFSNLNLLRIGYLKNSTIEPVMRASMATESIFGMRDLLPSISRMAYNSTRRAESSWLRASNKTKMRMLTKEVSEIKKLDLDTNIRRRAEAQQSISDIQTQIKDVENLIKRRQRKMFARRDAGDAKGKADAEASMQEAIDMRNGLLSALDDAMEQADRAEAAVNVAAAVLKEKRDEMYSITSKIYDADTAIKRIGEDKWTLDVDGVKYELDGLLDPNVKGVGAYLSEVDASQSYIAATAKSAFGRRIANQRRQWTKIKLADGDAYFNALAHIANRQLRNDEVARMVLQGRSKEDILQWLVTPAGNKYLRDMSGRWGVPDDAITSNALEQWVTHVYDTIDNMYAKDPVIKNLILERNVSTEEMRDLLSTRLPEELLPEINGPAINMMDLNGIEKTIAWTESKTDYLWGKLVGVETRLVRNPLFKKYVADSLARQVRYARANGIDVTQDIVNNQMRQVAYRDALDRVESVLYSARRMTNGGHIARYLMAFPTAYFNSQKTALKLLAKNPYNAYWYTRVTNATDVFGVYEDREGNKYTSIQDVPDGTAVTVQVPIYSKDSPEWLKPYMDPRGGGIKLNPKQFEFMIGDPSVSFIGAFSLSSIVMGAANNSVFGVYGEDIVQGLRKTFGDDFYESSIAYGGYLTSGETTGQRVVDTMVPPWMRSLLNAYKGARGDEEGFYGDTMFTSSVNATYKNAVAEWYRNGAVGTEPSYADAVKTAGFFALAKSFIQFNSFFSITFDPVTAAMTRYYGNSLDANGGDTERTEAEMVERFGIDVLAMLGSSSKNTGKFASTMEDIKIIRNHKDLLLDIYQKTNRPDLAGMLSGNYGEITNKYSTEVAALYRNMDYPGTGMDLVDTRTPKQIQEDAQVRMGWFEYSRAIDWRDAKMAELGIKSTYETGYRTSGLKAAMDQINEQLKTAYPRWNEARDNDRKNFREQTLVALKRITSDKKWMQEQEGPKWIEIALWVDAAENFYQEYDKLRAAGVRTTGLKQEFARWHYDYVSRKSTEFGEFSARWLTGMQELLDEEDIVNG